MLEQLERREAAALERVEELRAEALAAADRLDAAAGDLSRLVIARRTVLEVLADEPNQEVVTVAGLAAKSVPAPAQVRGKARDAAMYDRITAVLAKASGPMRARDVCEELGLGAEPKFTEAMRPKLRRLVADGVLAQVEPGLFALAAASR